MADEWIGESAKESLVRAFRQHLESLTRAGLDRVLPTRSKSNAPRETAAGSDSLKDRRGSEGYKNSPRAGAALIPYRERCVCRHSPSRGNRARVTAPLIGGVIWVVRVSEPTRAGLRPPRSAGRIGRRSFCVHPMSAPGGDAYSNSLRRRVTYRQTNVRWRGPWLRRRPTGRAVRRPRGPIAHRHHYQGHGPLTRTGLYRQYPQMPTPRKSQSYQ